MNILTSAYRYDQLFDSLSDLCDKKRQYLLRPNLSDSLRNIVQTEIALLSEFQEVSSFLIKSLHESSKYLQEEVATISDSLTDTKNANDALFSSCYHAV